MKDTISDVKHTMKCLLSSYCLRETFHSCVALPSKKIPSFRSPCFSCVSEPASKLCMNPRKVRWMRTEKYGEFVMIDETLVLTYTHARVGGGGSEISGVHGQCPWLVSLST